MKLDTPTSNKFHELDMLEFAQAYFHDKAAELACSSNLEEQKMARLWFVVESQLEKEIVIKFDELCNLIYEIKKLEAEEAKDGLLTEHSGS